MNIDWDKLQKDGKLEDPNIQNIINEVKQQFIEEKMRKCQEKNQEVQQNSENKERNILEQIALDQLEEEETQKKLEESKSIQNSQSSQSKNTNTKLCQNCKQQDKKVSSCAGCKEVYYCSVECQKADWKNHKKPCQIKQEEIKEIQRLEEKKKKKNIDWFEKIDNCGQGNFSVIQKMKEISTGKIYAIKVIEKKRLKQLGKEKDIIMEKHVLKKLSGSPYVIELFDTFSDELCLYMQMEFVDGGELWNYCRIFGLIGTSLVRYFFAKLLVALEFIHSKGIIHRDIKTENVLVTKDDKNIKFCDFGTSRDALDDSIQGAGTGRPGKKMFEHFVGTPNFMAPECVRNKASEYSSDIFSLGGLVFQLQTGFPPFLGRSEYLIFLQSEKQDPIFQEELWQNQDDLKDLILKMMKKEMTERITIPEIKKHPYFKNIDWGNLPTYEESLQKFTKEERFFQNIKGDLISNFNDLNEKADMVDKKFKEWEQKLETIDEFDEQEKGQILKRLQFMHKQAKQMFNIEEFFWQDFQLADKGNQKKDQSDDDEDDDDNDEDDQNQNKDKKIK
ncbi:Serine/Threonine kinase domain protein (macronuclear) [Tetrahymena thermophila SB210]|uniref:non-specific serine/threonine protein kinase n=1 Tax=Tetrahymena thermophila (strain SB210) TaxID=312017 RepID=I7MFC0_TETTS|nr:Serine/Threonine kinase domain protein [Tetrahymena thermophila SB210]EAR99605.1 Serine/Threonine kinase domain protein [Tetrahymena thermophila SB210]|eukprot:XP_001019850.1 Serine/Threonine kinase domain protein [Tetrahymena thermophila SB210]